MTQRTPKQTSGPRPANQIETEPVRHTAAASTQTARTTQQPRQAQPTRQTKPVNRTQPSQAVRQASAPAPTRKKKKKKTRILPIILIVLAIAAIVIGCIFIFGDKGEGGKETQNTESASKDTAKTKETTTEEEPTDPPEPVLVATATIGATGDILLHDSVLSAASIGGNDYDFTEDFTRVEPYWSEVDYMIANLEVTLGGLEWGSFRGYPVFNAPTDIVTGLKNAGVDMLLTANNHTYDTGSLGLTRTQQVIKEKGLDYIGTRLDTDDSYVLVKDINGIRFGFACYTYDTRSYAGEQKSLNGNVMNWDDQDLVNSFCYDDLGTLYESCAADMSEMEGAECDVTVFFIHWGNEYQDEPCYEQEEIAQHLADLGVDIIIGGHPHVVQKFDTLTGAEGNITYCLYSMGNCLSAQRKEVMVPEEPRGYTEDGVTFEFTYEKYSDGEIRLADIYVLPLWVDHWNDGTYTIVPLDYKLSVDDWRTYNVYDASDSYNRTLGRLGEVYPSVRLELGVEEVASEIN